MSLDDSALPLPDMRTLTALLLIALAAPVHAQSLLDRARAAVSGQSIDDRADEVEQRRLSVPGAPAPAAVLGAYLGSIRVKEQPSLGHFLEFDVAQFVFLPADEGTADLYRDGERVASYTWDKYTGRTPFTNIGRLQMTWPESDFSVLGYSLDQGGRYEIVYSADGEPFWKMPFTVTMTGSGDPYNPDPQIRLDGLWNDHAYILHDPDEYGEWQFKLWLHPEDFDASQNAYVRITADGSSTPVLIGGSKQSGAGSITNGNWQRKDFELMRPGKLNARGEYYDNRSFRANEETLPDGGYTATFYLGDEVYGRYPFTVSDGAIVPTGAQAPDYADPMTRIDGGGAAVWVYRQ